jgi:hydrogenase-4 component F
MTVPYLTGALVLGLLFFWNRNARINTILKVIFLIWQWSFTAYEYLHLHETELFYFFPDSLSILFLITLSIISVPVFFHDYAYIVQEEGAPRIRAIYHSALVFLVSAMSAAYLSSHIAVTWIFIELTTLSASALIYHRRNSESLEATWKYIFICSVSLAFVFIGILFLSLALGPTGSEDLKFSMLLQKAPALNTFWLKLAFVFIFTGFTAKMGLAPMFTAGIDAKDKAPTPAGALFSSALMNVGFIGIFRIYKVMALSELHQWANNVIWLSAGVSIFVAAVYMLKVKNLKRMFAYSSIEHMGIVMLGVASGGVGYYAATLHIILHSLVKSALFLQMGQVYSTYNSKSIYHVGQYFKYNLGGACLLLLAFFCVTAMPPSGLFFSEFLIFRAMFARGRIGMLIFVLFLLTLIIWAFGKNIFKLLFTPLAGYDEAKVIKSRSLETASQFVLLGLVIYLGMNPPSEFVTLIQNAVLILK